MTKNEYSGKAERLKLRSPKKDLAQDIALCHNVGIAIKDCNEAYAAFLQAGIELLCTPVVGADPSDEEYKRHFQEYVDSKMEFLEAQESQEPLPPVAMMIKNLRLALPYVRGSIVNLGKCRFTGSQLKNFISTVDKIIEDLAIEDMLKYMEYAIKFIPESPELVGKKTGMEQDFMGTLDKLFGEMKL